jgi:hypothetical protein
MATRGRERTLPEWRALPISLCSFASMTLALNVVFLTSTF